MYWQPVNLTDVCPVNSNLTACSTFGYVYLNLLVQLYGDSADRKNQEKDGTYSEVDKVENEKCPFRISEENKKEEYDFIVVGAGSAGCVVANRLSENKDLKVLLLEAGPEEPDITEVPGLSIVLVGSNIDWSYRTEPDGKSCLALPEGKCIWPRGKVMGGSGSINSMVYVRGNKLDFDTWAELGNDGWSYEEVLPYFKKSENNLNIEQLDRRYHGVNGEQPISYFPYIDKPSRMLIDAFHEKGLPKADFNGPSQFTTAQVQTVSREGKRVSPNKAFIHPIRHKRKNLTIKTDSEVTKILINENKQAYGVNYIKKGKLYTALANKEVILSAGAVNSPKILMLSGIGPKKHLTELGINVIKDLAVGENLHDHVTFDGVVIAFTNGTETTVSKGEVLKQVYNYYEAEKKEGPLSGNGPVSALAFIRTESNEPAPDMEYECNRVTDWREYIEDPVNYDRLSIFPTSFYNGVIPRSATLINYSRGKLLLNKKDPNGPPLLYPNYFGDKRDFDLVLRGVKFLLTLEDTDVFKSNGAYFVKTPLPACKNFKWGTEEYWTCAIKSYTSSAYHASGSCKMGPPSDKKAVVDPRLRVYGISYLRVIDASIMPNATRGNINAPTLMIGEKGVDLVLDDWKFD